MFLCFSLIKVPPISTLFPYTTLFRSALEDQPADHRAAQRARHMVPGDGRSGVEDQIAPHSGNHIRSARNPDENGRAVQDALHSELVGFVDGHAALQLRD